MELKANRFEDLRRQHVELMPKHKDFDFQSSPRLEPGDQRPPDQSAKIDHHQRASTDSLTLTSPFLGLR